MSVNIHSSSKELAAIQPKRRVAFFVFLGTFFAFLAVIAAILSPLDTQDSFSKPVTYLGFPVVRYGFPYLHQRVFVDSKTGDGDIISGRCFVEYLENGELKKAFGWRLRRKILPDRSAIGVSVQKSLF